MIFNTQKYKRIINWLLCAVIGILCFIYFKYSRTQEQIRIPDDLLHILLSNALVILVFELLTALNKSINQIQHWENKQLLHFITGFTINYITTVFVFSIVIFLYTNLFISFTISAFIQYYKQELNKFFIIAFFIIFILSFSQLIFYQFKQQYFLLLRTKSLKRKQLQLSIEAIHKQMNPHFLFNNLNTISSIILTQPDKTTTYLRNFAKFYNYLIKFQTYIVITIKEEINILHYYHHIINIRFNQLITLEINSQIENDEYYLPPLTLQLLYENVIKHNLITPEKPMQIKIELVKNQKIIFSNILSPIEKKTTISGKGLKNIQERIKLIANKKIEIKKDKVRFEVKIPLITKNDINQNIDITNNPKNTSKLII